MSTIDKFGSQLNAKKGSTFFNAGSVRDTFPLDKDGNYNAQNKRIKLLQDPVEKQDVTNKRWIETNFLRTHKDQINVGHKRLANLITPVEMSDAVTKGFVDGRLLNPSVNNTAFDFLGKTLKNVSESQGRSDVATVSFVEKRYSRLNDELTAEIKTRTNATFSSFSEELKTIRTEIASIKALVAQHVTLQNQANQANKE